MEYILLAFALVFNTVANVLMKIGAGNLTLFKEFGFFQGLIKNYVILIGITLFAVNIVFYTLALSKINLSIAYPIMSVGGLVLITLISWGLFREDITRIQIGGIMMLVVGILLVSGKFN